MEGDMGSHYNVFIGVKDTIVEKVMKKQMTAKENLFNEIKTVEDGLWREHFESAYGHLCALENDMHENQFDSVCNTIIASVRHHRQLITDELTMTRNRIMYQKGMLDNRPKRPMRYKEGMNDSEFLAYNRYYVRRKHQMAVFDFYLNIND